MSPLEPCRWFAAGKHPCAKDFFTIGESFALAESLCRWVAAGYQPGMAAGSSRRSWRFWAGGGKTLSYGVLKDSSDSFGRPFPLLVMGQERAKGWERGWEALPEALAGIWASMEAIASSVLPDLPALKSQIRQGIDTVASPLPDVGSAAGEGTPGVESLIEAALRRDAKLVSLSCQAEALRAGTFAAAAHAALKQKMQKPPGSVFIGGAPGNPRMLFFYRPLAGSDFSMLWSDDAGAEDGVI